MGQVRYLGHLNEPIEQTSRPWLDRHGWRQSWHQAGRTGDLPARMSPSTSPPTRTSRITFADTYYSPQIVHA